MIPDDMIDSSILACKERIESAQELIDMIEKDGVRFYMAKGNEDMREVTDERLAKQKAIIAQNEELIAAYEKHRA